MFHFPPGSAMKRVRIFDMAGGLTQDPSGRADIIERDLLDGNGRPVVGKVHPARRSIEGGASTTLCILAKGTGGMGP